jgi:hypothetical protein
MPEPVALAPWTAVRQVIVGWFQRSFGDEFARFTFDIADANPTRGYSLIDPDCVSAMLEGDPRLDRGLYAQGRYDCEDFAIAARSAVTFASAQAPNGRHRLPVAFGVVFTAAHALNIGIAPDRQPYLYDHYYNRVWKEETLDDALQDLTEIGTGWLKAVRYILI